jgi:hypothetical protein
LKNIFYFCLLPVPILGNLSHVLRVAHAVKTQHDFANCPAAVGPVKRLQYVDYEIRAYSQRRAEDGLLHAAIRLLIDITLHHDNFRFGIGFNELRGEYHGAQAISLQEELTRCGTVNHEAVQLITAAIAQRLASLW